MTNDKRLPATDVLSPAQRRYCMSRNRGRDTGPEVALRHKCWAKGMRYTLHAKLIGQPDFAFPREKVAIFVDGCFWHGCPLHYSAPATRGEFWRSKLDANRARDTNVTAALRDAGWAVLRFWEHELRADSDRERLAEDIRRVVLSRR